MLQTSQSYTVRVFREKPVCIILTAGPSSGSQSFQHTLSQYVGSKGTTGVEGLRTVTVGTQQHVFKILAGAVFI